MAENFTFLTLVPEIRDQIYEFVLGSSIAPPKSPSVAGYRGHQARLDSSGFSWSPEYTTYYPLQPFPWPGAALVRTCRQVYAEVAAISRVVEIRNRAKNSCNHELDIMINEERTLYPTWLNLPFAKPTGQRPVDQIWADLRTMGVFDPSMRRTRRSGWTHVHTWPPSLISGLFNMLNLFFAYGPSFQKTCPSNRMGHARETHTGIAVPRLEELVINVVTPTEEEMEGRSYADTWDMESVGVLRPEKLAETLMSYIEYLQNPPSHGESYAMQYGIFEKLGKIRLCLDRKELESWSFGLPLGHEEVLHPSKRKGSRPFIKLPNIDRSRVERRRKKRRCWHRSVRGLKKGSG